MTMDDNYTLMALVFLGAIICIIATYVALATFL